MPGLACRGAHALNAVEARPTLTKTYEETGSLSEKAHQWTAAGAINSARPSRRRADPVDLGDDAPNSGLAPSTSATRQRRTRRYAGDRR